ncbi:two pore domain potassium channel family protein [Nitrospirota bacterium]
MTRKRGVVIRDIRLRVFVKDIIAHTPFLRMVILLITLWMVFSGLLYLSERGAADTHINSYGKALYWGVAAFSTAGIADSPKSGFSLFIGGVWIITGSILFFGTIVATVTTYFMRPILRPHRQIIDTIEYNLEQLETLSVEELDLLKETIDTLIIHMEQLKGKPMDK